MTGSLVHRGLAEFIQASTHFRATQYTLLAGCTLWAYDILLTFDTELTLLWSRKGSLLLKTIYILNRYLPLLGFGMAISDYNPLFTLAQNKLQCSIHLIVVTACQTVGIIMTTTIFTIRLYSIYFGHPRIRILLVGVTMVSHVTLIVITANLMVVSARTMYYNPLLRFCISDVSWTLGGYYVVPIFVETFIAFATLYHAVVFREHRTTMRETPTTAVLNALYADGFWFYLYALCLRVALCIVYWNAAPTLILVLCYLEYGLTSTITSRWFLKFRKLLIDQWETPTTTRVTGAQITNLTDITGASINIMPRGHATFTSTTSAAASGSRSTDPTMSLEAGMYAPTIQGAQEGEPYELGKLGRNERGL